MEQSLKSISEKKKQAGDDYEQENPYGPGVFPFDSDLIGDDDDDVEEIIPQNISGARGRGIKPKATITHKGKGKNASNIGDYFAPRTTPGSQPTIKSVLAGKDALNRPHMVIAKYMYDTCTPINAANSMYFQKMFDAAIAIGPGFKVPSYHQLRVYLLRDLNFIHN